MVSNRKKISNFLYKYGTLGYCIYEFIIKIYIFCMNMGTDKIVTVRKYKKIYGHHPNLINPKTLNEKMLWLKLFVHKDFHTICADKFMVREYIKDTFGESYLIPLLFETKNWKDITYNVIPNEYCIIKASHTQGDMLVVKDKSRVDIKKLRFDCRTWLNRNLYNETQEWQYKNCTPRIIIEKLLQTHDGYIPNDYKLHFFNGYLKFVYCSVGRETVNKRNIYDSDWNPLYFSWVEPSKNPSNIRGEEIPAPATFQEMKRLGGIVAKNFDYVRVDFYDVDGKLYFGEITLHHGSGFDVFVPQEYDIKYGQQLTLTK